MAELVFQREAAAEYDRAFAHVTRYFMPFVLRAADVAPGMRILDIACGTGLSAEAAFGAIGSAGAMLLYSFGLKEEAAAVDAAIEAVLKSGRVTADLRPDGTPATTEEVGTAVCAAIG